MAVLCSMEGLSCAECLPRDSTAGEVERVRDLRKRKGCNEPTLYPQYIDAKTREKFYRCPVSQLDGGALLLLELFIHYEAGFLPGAGGVLEQSAWIMERLRAVRSAKLALIEVKAEHEKKQGAKFITQRGQPKGRKHARNR